MSSGFDAGHPTRISKMSANPGASWLSVHALAEFTFCPRAGLIAFETKSGADDESPAFDTLPRFELQAIEEAIAKCVTRLLLWLGAMIGVILTRPVFGPSPWLWMLALGLLAQPISKTVKSLRELLHRRRVALACRCAEPDPRSRSQQRVNWFGLLNLGFESRSVGEPLRDSDWKIEGKPWRILHKGSLSIPVFRTRSPQDAPRESQIVKIMAYCHLSSQVFGIECPYGIILTDADYGGFAVPNCEPFRKNFHENLIALRDLVQGVQRHEKKPVAYEAFKCAQCPLGKPRPNSLGQSFEQIGVPLLANLCGTSSECGDRFAWRPPFSS